MIPILLTSRDDFEARFSRLLLRADAVAGDDVRARVAEIVEAVRTRGDAAVVELTARYDDRPGLTANNLEIPARDLETSLERLDRPVREALQRAAGRIRAFHGVQRAQIDDAILDDGRGLRAELRVRPLATVGIYVPGGTAAYPSSVLMNAIPAKVTGVPDVVMVTPAPKGIVPPAVLAAACLAGVDRVFGVGGAQAVAALAFGTATIPRVDKIVGPGNAYVAEAKRQVYGIVDIDHIAGPSEVLIVADDSAPPSHVAADLIAQAEHDVRAAAIAVVLSESFAGEVALELERQAAALPRRDVVASALSARGAIIVARDRAQAIEIANRYAPEHLGLAVRDPEDLLEEVDNAGAVFLGHLTPEALGDYDAGTNHVLPTAGTARFGSPLSVHDFLRRMNVLSVDRRALERIGPDAVLLARVEGLEGHARAVEMRRAHGKAKEEER